MSSTLILPVGRRSVAHRNRAFEGDGVFTIPHASEHSIGGGYQKHDIPLNFCYRIIQFAVRYATKLHM